MNVSPLPSDAGLVSQNVTSQEKTLAGALNIAAIPMPYLGPLIGLAVSGKSKFIKFHAYRSLIEQVVSTALTAVIIIASLSYSIYSMVRDGVFANGLDLSKIDWVTLIVKSAVSWAAFGLWGLYNTINSIRDGLQALSGKIPDKMKWSERLAAKWARLV